MRLIRRPLLSLVWLFAASTLLCAGRAAAEPDPDPAAVERLARLHFEAGKQAFELGHFADAVVEFQRGYDLSQRPLFLLNLAYANFRLERYEQTAALCRRFLAASPPASSVQEAKQLLGQAEMHQRLREAAAPTPAPTPAPALTAPLSAPASASPAAEPTTAGARRRPARPALAWSGLAALAVGVGALAGAAALTVMAQELNHDFNHPTPGTVYDHQLLDRWNAEQQAAIGLYVVGGAAIVGGVVMSVAGWRAPAEGRPRRWSLLPALAPSLVGARAALRF